MLLIGLGSSDTPQFYCLILWQDYLCSTDVNISIWFKKITVFQDLLVHQFTKKKKLLQPARYFIRVDYTFILTLLKKI